VESRIALAEYRADDRNVSNTLVVIKDDIPYESMRP